MLEFRRKYSLSPLDEGEGRLAGGPTWRGAEGPHHALELLDPVIAMLFELVEGLGLQSP